MNIKNNDKDSDRVIFKRQNLSNTRFSKSLTTFISQNINPQILGYCDNLLKSSFQQTSKKLTIYVETIWTISIRLKRMMIFFFFFVKIFISCIMISNKLSLI